MDEEKVLRGVSRLSDGSFRLALSPRDRKITVTLPHEVVDLLDKERKGTSKTRTDVIEDALIRYLRSEGYRLER